MDSLFTAHRNRLYTDVINLRHPPQIIAVSLTRLRAAPQKNLAGVKRVRVDAYYLQARVQRIETRIGFQLPRYAWLLMGQHP